MRNRYFRLRDEVCDYIETAERHSFDLAEGIDSLSDDELEAAIRGRYPPPDLPGEGERKGTRETRPAVSAEQQRVWGLVVDGRHLAGQTQELAAELRVVLEL